MILTQFEVQTGEIIDPTLCRLCQGRCCQRNACDCSPLDFDNDMALVDSALASGNYSIDFARLTPNAFFRTKEGYLTLDVHHIWSSPDEAFYVRPRNQNRPIVDFIHDMENEGPCIFWTLQDGCKLDYHERPMFGRLLAPGDCIFASRTRDALVSLWKPYTDELFDLAQKYFSDDWVLYQDFCFRL